jgi:flavin reductase (DIM6/NTAB) family NADH-FMN oxidoreductase RutF
MLLDFLTMDRRTSYFWMASTIAPRPVAWVSTVSSDGIANLAPFSFFQMITPHPPTLMICPQHNGDGSLKDTAQNIQATGEFTVSEFDAAGVLAAPSSVVAPARVAGSPMSFECRTSGFTLHPAAQPTCAIILGEVVAAHADASIVGADGIIDPVKLDLVSRMGADWYGRTNSMDNFTLPRPAGWAR